MEKVYVVHAFLNKSRFGTSKFYGRGIYVLYSDNTWEEVWVKVKDSKNIDEICKVFRINNLTQKKMSKGQVYTYIEECEAILNKEVEI